MEAQAAASLDKLRHVVTDAPRVMVVDGSRLVRKLIADVLQRQLPGARVIACEGLESARAALAAEPVDLVTTALVLPDGDGLAVARLVREAAGQSYVPVIVVSGDVQSRLEARSLNDDVTDYFDKALGHQALAEFIRGYVQPQPVPGARVLYVEDSRVVAVATKRMLERQDLEVLHFTEAEGALDYLRGGHARGVVGADLMLTDVYLKGQLSGVELLAEIRGPLGYSKRVLPVLVMTGDANVENQSQLLRDGANDLVLKPIEERLLVTKTLFQLRVARLPEQRSF
jgi:DNA-binding response OmpR family regulator